MTRDTDDDSGEDEEPAATGDHADDEPADSTADDSHASHDAVSREAAPSPAAATPGDAGGERSEPHVSVTIEGEYETVMGRVDHPRAFQYGDLGAILDNLEHTLIAVGTTGGGIRSEIYEAADVELDDPWEIRKYLEVLAMHDLVRLEDDRWVTSVRFEQERGEDRS